MKQFLTIAALGWSFSALPQTYQGHVVDPFGHPVPFVTVLNVSDKSGSLADENGRFRIEANRGDTLKFRATGFLIESLTIDDSANERVMMRRDTISLKPVVILSKSLREAILELRLPEEEQVVTEDPWEVEREPFALPLPILKPYPGIYMSVFPPAMVINLDEFILEVKKRAPKPRRAKLLPVWN